MPIDADSISAHSSRSARYPWNLIRGECAAILERHRAGAAYDPADAASFLAAAKKAMESEPDFDGLLAELDAGRIYAEYVELLADAAQK